MGFKARITERTVVTWLDEDGDTHSEEATAVNDSTGFLFFLLAEQGEDGASARLIPESRLVRVDFAGPIVITHDDHEVYSRKIEDLEDPEVSAALAPIDTTDLEPADFA